MSPYDKRIDASRLAFVQLRGHVGIVDAELLVADRLDAVQVAKLLNVLQAALSVTGGLSEVSDVLRCGIILLHIRHQTRHLIAVYHRYPKHVVFSA